MKKTLIGHGARVNVIEICYYDSDRIAKSPYAIVSGDSNGQLGLWLLDSENYNINIEPYLWNGHSKSITSISSLQGIQRNGEILFCSTGSDGLIKIWSYQSINSIKLKHEISSKSNCIPIASSMIQIDSINDAILLAVGGSDQLVSIYLLSSDKCSLCFELSGHEDWIKSLAFAIFPNDSMILLASASQDKYIRLWKFDLVDAKSLQYSQSLQIERHIFPYSQDQNLQVSLHSLLVGHDDWVTNISWTQTRSIATLNTPLIVNNEKILLSSSSDGNIIIWSTVNDINESWKAAHVLGGLNDSFGYYTVCPFVGSSMYITSHSYTGSLHLWKKTDETFSYLPCCTGHAESVQSVDCINISNDSNTSSIMIASASLDKTTRIFNKISGIWRESSRAQIHGYEMKCISFITTNKFASAGDEKVVRIFQEPSTSSAELPSLSLTNKPIKHTIDKMSSIDVTERELASMTLWPEISKLYGHPYEIFSLAVDRENLLLAAACKSTLEEYASIRIWTIDDKKPFCQPLTVHKLTVTKLEFSACNRYLISVSRDRSWALFKRHEEGFKLIHHIMEAHSRIIWCVGISFDSQFIFTGSRDKKVKCWNLNSGKEQACLVLTDSITSISIWPKEFDRVYPLIIGLENGTLIIAIYNPDNEQFDILKEQK